MGAAPRGTPGGAPSAAFGLPLPLLLAWRFLTGGGSRVLSSTARAALAAIGLGVAAMVIAMALMTGYREDLQRKLIGGNAAIVLYPLGDAGRAEGSGPAEVDAGPGPAEVDAAVEAVPGVVSVTRVAYAQGALSSAAVEDGVEVTLRGVDPGGTGLGGQPLELAAPSGELPGVVLGDELARRLAVARGDRLRLVALGFDDGRPRFRYRSLEVAGTFSTGLSEFDREWGVIGRALAEELTGAGAGGTVYEVALEEPGDAGELLAAVREAAGPGYLASDWRELNRELFTALRVQQIALFFVLGLIVLVSTFNLGSTLMVLVREKMRAVGALAALGLDAAALRRLFLVYGLFLGAVGTLAGIAFGASVAWVITEFELIRFDPEVAAIYFIRSVPFRVRPLDLAAIAAFTLAVTLLACWAPARRAARVSPSEALRYE